MKLKTKLNIVVIPTAVNLFILFFYSNNLGGSAFSGHIKDGVYYLRNHGVYTEVSASTWNFISQWEKLTFLSMIISAIAIVVGVVFSLRKGQLKRKVNH